jgi:hypothetical protein
MERAPISCVWCPTPLSAQNLAIDHVLPFSQTQNNNLWNLLPSCKKCNAAKSDNIPTPDILKRRRDAILICWQLSHNAHPEAFEEEIRYDLVGYEEPAFLTETALKSLSNRCDFLIKERGYNPWGTN